MANRRANTFHVAISVLKSFKMRQTGRSGLPDDRPVGLSKLIKFLFCIFLINGIAYSFVKALFTCRTD